MTSEELKSTQIRIDTLYVGYLQQGVGHDIALAATALKLAAQSIVPDESNPDKRLYTVRLSINGVKLWLTLDPNREYLYRKAAKVANNIFSQIKPNISNEQELWHRVLLELALTSKIV